MNTIQINKSFLKNKFFKGVFPCDQLPMRRFKLPYALVINTHPASLPGTHWVALYVNRSNHAEFFDSFGRPLLNKYIVDFIDDHCTSACWNSVRIQSESSEKCGQFALGYIKARLQGVSPEDFISTFHIEEENLLENDVIIEKWNRRCKAYRTAIKSKSHKHRCKFQSRMCH